MRKEIRKLCCVILTFVMCFGMTIPTMAASSTYNAAVSSYRSFVRTAGEAYQIVDLDGNGIPELVVYNKSCNEVYTYNPKTGRMKCLKSLSVGKGYNLRAKYSRSKHQVVLTTANTGGNTVYIYRIKGQRAIKVLEAEYLNGKFGRFDPAYRQGYKINGKRVSTATYNKKVTSYIKGFSSI